MLFEVSWEVCNRVGGIHTVVSTKAKTLVRELGDAYVAVGPWLLTDSEHPPPFDEEEGFEGFAERCRRLGVPVRVGRWRIPGRPRTLLVEFSGLYERKDDILAGLWETHEVDSIVGGWDYVEPLLFGHAAGMVVEQWWEEFGAPDPRGTVAQFHEWMTGSGMLYLQKKVPAIGTVFTTHATMLGRSIASRGDEPIAGLGERTPEEAADEMGIRAKHSLEGACARIADVFTTVSEVTAEEAERFHRRRPQPILPNGIDLEVMAELQGETPRDEVERRLRDLAASFLGEPVDDAALLAVSGRYEFHNKGIDLLLDAMARLDAERDGRRVVLFMMIPAGNSGVRNVLAERLSGGRAGGGPLGISTHDLFDPEQDPIQSRCRELGLDNAVGSRVKVIHTPIYFGQNDGLLELPYEAVLRAMDLSCFPSSYEPWGYTPLESLALGVPTVTTDCAGFGRWMRGRDLDAGSGVHVLCRRGVAHDVAVDELAGIVERSIAADGDRERLAGACRETASLTAWSGLIRYYEAAFDAARDAAAGRSAPGPKRFRAHVAGPALLPAAHPELHRFDVAPSIPPLLRGLEELAANLWWTWNEEAPRLFAELSPDAWEASGRNPVRFLDTVEASVLAHKEADGDYTARLDAVVARFRLYLEESGDERWPADGATLSEKHPVAYFCAEFGLHESLPIYSGGLGVLAGDHIKSASDLNLPLVAVGLYYRRGYVRQHLTAASEPISVEVDNDPGHQPAELVTDADGEPLEITLRLPSSVLTLRVWRIRVGRVPLYLLDSDVEANRPEDRKITHRLYRGSLENRLLQEIVLGRGGVRLLRRLGIEPAAYHLNEGHAAFVAIERIGRLVRREGLTFDEARLLVRATTAFTTHTPVPAGHDRFDEGLLRRYFSDVSQWAGVTWERFVALGRVDGDESFNMTHFGCRFAGFVNGVSREHGKVSRSLLHPLWPMLLESEVPVESVTNGVHLPTWASPEVAALVGARERPVRGSDFAAGAAGIASRDLWEARRKSRRRLIEVVKRRMEAAFLRRHDSPALLARMLAPVHDGCLLIGFARRFAPYKRADLVLHDRDRLRALLDDAERPVRLLVAGKAHPRDEEGLQLMRGLADAARSDEFVGKILFLEDYDLELARALVRGTDVWLNTPIRALEASGTSGMKVAANGGLNLSISDGWWIEGADGQNGWTIGNHHRPPLQDLQNELDADHLYQLLEEEIVPLFFDRDAEGLPQGWLERVRRSLGTIPPVFDTDRMVEDYTSRAYTGLAASFHALRSGPDLRRIAEQHRLIRKGFGAVSIVRTELSDLRDVKVGDEIEARVEVELGDLSSAGVVVELVLGAARDDPADLADPVAVALAPPADGGTGAIPFTGSCVIERAGTFSYGVRVRVRPRDPWDVVLSDLVLWA
ncbi:MAG: alpha-glucan family phosphorylase [Planctomycetota bacterium]|nr:alpha-glucan family phosphorylase [Planctomycetota bacterium]